MFCLSTYFEKAAEVNEVKTQDIIIIHLRGVSEFNEASLQTSPNSDLSQDQSIAISPTLGIVSTPHRSGELCYQTLNEIIVLNGVVFA